jgi:hypothetical protein
LQIVLRVIHANSWSTYIFDFVGKRTTILDPMINIGYSPEHKKLAVSSGRGRGSCMDCILEFFEDWITNTNGWQNWFPKQTTGPWVCSR